MMQKSIPSIQVKWSNHCRIMPYTSLAIRQCLHFGFKLQWDAATTARHIQEAYGGDAVSIRTAQDWFRRFREGREDLEDEPRQGRPPAIDDDRLNSLIMEDPRQSLRQIASQLCCSFGAVQSHIHSLGKVRKLDKWVPHKLSDDQKWQRLTICTSLLSRRKEENFLNQILTCDEKWVAYDNMTRSYQWLDPDEPPHQIPKPEVHSKKLLISVWWTAAGLLRYEVLPPGHTITADVYCQQMLRVHDDLLRKQAALVNRRGVLLLHDNARPHVAKKSRDQLAALGWQILPHPAYSPDISPTDYYLFAHIAHFMRGKQFKTQTEVINDLNLFFEQKSPSYFKAGIEKLVERWQKVVDANGDYFIE